MHYDAMGDSGGRRGECGWRSARLRVLKSIWVALTAALICAGCSLDFDKFARSDGGGTGGGTPDGTGGHGPHASGGSGGGDSGSGGAGGSGGSTGTGGESSGSGGSSPMKDGGGVTDGGVDSGVTDAGDGGGDDSGMPSPKHPCDTASCDPLASCDETSGVAVCKCPPGYVDKNLNGTDCTDKDECASNNGGCRAKSGLQEHAGQLQLPMQGGLQRRRHPSMRDEQAV